MSLSELIKMNREKTGISQKDLAAKLSIPLDILVYLEDQVENEEKMIVLCANAFDVSVAVFKGEEPPKPKELTEEEKREIAVKGAMFPNIRKFILDPVRCTNPDKALALFADQPLSLAEKNVILYLSTTALYHFCDTNTSSFSFDSYLFKLHRQMLESFEKELDTLGLSTEEKNDRLDSARSNIFACDTIANIAIRVVDSFAEEMEQKLASAVNDFDADLSMPFRWRVDDTLLKIDILSEDGTVKDQIRLLDVKART